MFTETEMQSGTILQSKTGTLIHILFLLILSFTLCGHTSHNTVNGTTTPEKGIITDTIKCKKNQKFSYALYLPGHYNLILKWPVIYIFDPAARGSLAVKNFIQAAEHYGYIVACSNNSRNGSLNNSIDAANYMFDDVENRLSIDFRRIYTAGFSGGSRVAALMALTTKNIAGVIGCGAGFPSGKELPHGELDSFVYIGIVGKRDMNYLEMFDLEQELNSHKIVVRLITTDSDHNWPDPKIIDDAVAWLELQAMAKGTKTGEQAFIDYQFKNQTEEALKMGMNGEWFEAARQYRYLLRDFPNRSDIAQYRTRLDSIEKSKAFRKDVRNWNSIRAKELSMYKTFMVSLNDAVKAEIFTDSIQGLWKREIGILKRTERSQNKEEQCMAARLLSWLGIICWEEGKNSLKISNYRKAIVEYQILTMLQPDNAFSYYHLSRAYAFQNLNTESLTSLERAIKLGIKSRSVVENDSAFLKLKNDKHYKMLLNKIQ
jgi:predicted esterase